MKWKPENLWPLAIVGVLGVTVLANVALLVASRGAEAPQIEPDYYRKAMAWDTTMAQERVNQGLGWHVEARLGPVGAGGAELRVRVLDRSGAALDGAQVRVEALNNLDRGGPLATTLTAAAAAGEYAAQLPLPRAGLWELRFAVIRGGVRFTESVRCDTGAPS